MSEITGIVKHGKETYSIFLDGMFFCKLNAETIVKHGFKVGNNVSEDEIENAQSENEKLVAFDRCLKLLSAPKSKKQVKDYLYSKGYTSKTVDFCISKLEEYNYLDDQAFADMYVKSYCYKKGKRLLDFELKAKGISEEKIRCALEHYNPDEDDLLCLSEKFLKNKPRDKKTMSKLAQHLFSKGFSFDEINPVLKKLIDFGENNENWD